VQQEGNGSRGRVAEIRRPEPGQRAGRARQAAIACVTGTSRRSGAAIRTRNTLGKPAVTR